MDNQKKMKKFFKNLKKILLKSYLIGKNINFLKKQIKFNVEYFIAGNLKNSIVQIMKDIRFKIKKITRYY